MLPIKSMGSFLVGSYTKTQFDWYIKLENRTREFSRKERSCTDTECTRHGRQFCKSEKFCSTCGSQVATVPVPVKSKFDLFDLESFADQFIPTGISNDEHSIWVYNYHGCDLPGLRLDTDYQTVIDVQTMKKAFSHLEEVREEIFKRHSEFFAELRKSGLTFELHFGLLNYFN